jgi:hypothetical protein
MFTSSSRLDFWSRIELELEGAVFALRRSIWSPIWTTAEEVQNSKMRRCIADEIKEGRASLSTWMLADCLQSKADQMLLRKMRVPLGGCGRGVAK